MATKRKDMWRVLRCAFHYKSRVTEDLEAQGFVVHDCYLNTTAGVQPHEEFTIIAKRVPA